MTRQSHFTSALLRLSAFCRPMIIHKNASGDEQAPPGGIFVYYRTARYLAKVSLQQTSECLAVSCLVARHVMDGGSFVLASVFRKKRKKQEKPGQ